MPTKQDLQRLRKHLYLAIFTIAVLVGAINVQLIRAYHTPETADLNDMEQHEMSDSYILGTLSDSWSHNHTDILLLSEQEGWVFLKHPIEFNMSTFTGYNSYLLQDSDAQKLQIDNILQSVYIASSTKLSVFVHYGRQADATFFIPVDKCAHEYTIPMHNFCEKSLGKITLIAPYNDAEVTITLRQVAGTVEFNGKVYNSGNNMSVQVPRHKILTIGHNTSLSGTTMHSTTPVCVLAGTGCKDGQTTCKSVITTVLPSSQLSRFFIVPNVVTNRSRLQLVSTEDNNNVVIHRYSNKEQLILKTSQTYDIDLIGREPTVITSDRDIIVTVLARPVETDLFLLWIVGVDQYRSSYRFFYTVVRSQLHP
ncbi:uncharacterized protein LOC117341283 [Pecten maximus]|uniref:uncharacterized protein LOC117341283 n=1 Tax=Pecten maximus TaxID=6579 RepID=UPI001458FD38|nr:uncharacterized protein LOC117341283 [Pecten maximus]